MTLVRLVLFTSLSWGASCSSETPTAAKPQAVSPTQSEPAKVEPSKATAPVALSNDANDANNPPPATTGTAGDSFEIVASHGDPSPDDPAVIRVPLKVLQAKFDPQSPAGGTATIELDAAGIESNSRRRDGHLRSPDYLDANAHPTIRVDVTDVRKAAGAWEASVALSFRGADHQWVIPFEVVSQTDTSIRIKGAHTFDRTAIGLGRPHADGDSVADTIEARFHLTLLPS